MTSPDTLTVQRGLRASALAAIALLDLGACEQKTPAPPAATAEFQRQLIAEMGAKALDKVRTEVSAWFADAPQARDTH